MQRSFLNIVLKNLNKIFLVVLVLCPLLYAHHEEGHFEKIQIGFSLALPPYVIPESNSGIEVDILREAFKETGYTVIPNFVSYNKVSELMDNNEISGVVRFTETSPFILKKCCFSDFYITFQNFAVTLKKNNIKINSVDDLKDKKVIGFYRAERYLGEKYREAVKGTAHYYETAKQGLQILKLYKEKTDVIIIDKKIFQSLKKNLREEDTKEPVTMHKIFKKTRYKVAFKSHDLRDAFNKGLKIIKRNGTYDKIIKKYTE